MAATMRQSMKEIAEWTQDFLETEGPGGELRRKMNRTILSLQPNEEADRACDTLRGLVESVCELVHERNPRARASVMIEGKAKGWKTAEEQREVFRELLADPLRFWNKGILFELDPSHPEEYPSDSILLDTASGAQVCFRAGLEGSADPFAVRVLSLYRDAEAALATLLVDAESERDDIFEPDDTEVIRYCDPDPDTPVEPTKWERAYGKLEEILVGREAELSASCTWLGLNVLGYGTGARYDVFDVAPELHEGMGGMISEGPINGLWPPFVSCVHGALEFATRHLDRLHPDFLLREHRTTPHILTIDHEHKTATLDGETYPITETQALILQRLLDAERGRVTGEELNEMGLSIARPDRIIKRLPAPIRELITATRGPGGGSSLILE